MWTVSRLKSLWHSNQLNFQHHLFQLTTRMVCADYARHANERRDYLPNAASIPYTYTHTVAVESDLSKVFGGMAIVNSFFVSLGIFQGKNHLEDFTKHFHFMLFNALFLKDPPRPDMRMLAFHATMYLITTKFEGDFWKFATHFKWVYRQDLRCFNIRGLIKALPVYNVKLGGFSSRFLVAMIGKHWKKKSGMVRPVNYREEEEEEEEDDNATTTDSDDDFIGNDMLSHLSIGSEEQIFRPIVFSWNQDKCYY